MMSDDELMDTSPPMLEDDDLSDNESVGNKYEGDLTGDGGVEKVILKQGEGYKRPEKGDEVRVNYIGKLLGSEDVFDNSYDRGEPLKFTLGSGQVIKGWDVAVATMKKGEKAKVTIKPEYGYGENGMPPKIPENATLVFEMELVDWTSVKDMFGDGKVMKYILEEGTGWERPTDKFEVFVNVLAKTKDNRVLWEEKELSFVMGENQVPEFLEKAIKDMKKSAKLRLVCRDERIRVAGLPFQIPHDIDCVEYELELIRWNKVEDVSKDGGVVKKMVKEGEGWEKPSDDTKAIVNMIMKDCNTQKIIEEKSNWEVIVGDGVVIEGVDLALETMKKGEKAVLTVAPNYAFKEAGIVPPEGVSKDSTVIVELELVSFERAKDSWNLSKEEKIENALRTKDKGNELFKSGRYKLAKKKYEKVVNNLEFDVKNKSDLNAEQKQQGKSILLQTYLNLAACEEKFCNSNGVLKQCNKALEIDSVNVKALFRRASAYLRSSEVLLAEKDLKRALELDPSNMQRIADYSVICFRA
ncbi:FK506-binding protein 4/5 [Galdieria sulphuraria]|uniref:peptidylprolyl isomerase n=1 Tax=Galdieria sulphuraria TaxID=130081 RepID=M2VTX1_GALSU|nr:FK506-binding protein 4/5 [Galdieria sulphuraria]EME26651.1 FK506-binding protein 4/5 [Galdieria sulphuraria]|eukprot:XP_005703171.1 FK506-binding protein 4/5 [Galdieria sulphuraria]